LLSGGTAPVRPETLYAYSAGLKSEWLDRKLQANLEAFYYNYLNQQESVIRNGGEENINAALTCRLSSDHFDLRRWLF
jgi:hypothetical protein